MGCRKCGSKVVAPAPFSGAEFNSEKKLSGNRFLISTSEDILINGYRLKAGGTMIIFQSQFDELVSRGAKIWKV